MSLPAIVLAVVASAVAAELDITTEHFVVEVVALAAVRW